MKPAQPSSSVRPIKIVVLDRGFVFVGRVMKDETDIYIDDARCIRNWGTTNGLGELRNGPTSNTVLDVTGTVCAPLRALIFTIDCDQAAWAPELA